MSSKVAILHMLNTDCDFLIGTVLVEDCDPGTLAMTKVVCFSFTEGSNVLYPYCNGFVDFSGTVLFSHRAIVSIADPVKTVLDEYMEKSTDIEAELKSLEDQIEANRLVERTKKAQSGV